MAEGSTTEPLRIATLFVRHGTERYPGAEKQLDAVFRRHMPEVDRTTFIIDNALSAAEATRSDGATLLGGDNEHWEFSAWDRAVAHLGRSIWSYDLVHLATSAFDTLYTQYLNRFSESMLQCALERPMCLGHVDCYDEAVRIGHFRSQHWVRTSFLFLPPAELKALGSLISFDRSDRLFSDDPGAPFVDDAPISKNYQDYLLGWLTGTGTGQGVEWHSRFALDASTFAHFQKKVIAILNEHLFAIRLRALGCSTVDVTWLATQLGREAARDVAWDRSWRGQLAERDTDSIRLDTPPRPGTQSI